ncbi:hypothetical protein PHMEG_00017554 [Phytophthora megakarya]|uniref:Uncharacterized protein n=1 Tax=Phytophthora megakarya TaxID=4795 RepID=A0A225VX29_9STRA|nr:hypothetical protein PHMEG_00017554 [Phytophthora megakarya]
MTKPWMRYYKPRHSWLFPNPDQSRGAAITLLHIVPVLAELEILNRAVNQMVMDESSNGSGGGGGGGSPVDPAGMPLVSTMLPRRPFAADYMCIPGRQQTRQYNIADVDTCVDPRIEDQHFDDHDYDPGSAISHLITGQNVRDLMAALSWNVLTCANIPKPMSFEITVDGRLGFLIDRYSAVEVQDLIAYWESTHRFPVSPALVLSDPYLALFVVERNNRRSHAGARWKQILQLFLIAMREG